MICFLSSILIKLEIVNFSFSGSNLCNHREGNFVAENVASTTAPFVGSLFAIWEKKEVTF